MTIAVEPGKNKSKPVNAGNRRPKYLQLAEQIQAQVEAGIRRPGEQLPSFAQMQAEHNLSQSTLEKMYQVLEQKKLIVREPGRGVYIAQAKRTRTGVLGLFVNQASANHPYYSHLLAGTREAARREGMEVLLLNDIKTADWEKLDGVLICFGYATQIIHLLPLGLPHVSLLYPLGGMPQVTADDYHGMAEAVEYLLQLGHRRISYVTVAVSQGADPLSHRRLEAYCDTLKAHDIVIEPNWVQSLREPYESNKKFVESGRDKMRRWLNSDWHRLDCTAILAQNDEVAIGMIEVLQEAGIDVPGDVSVVGFDGAEVAEFFRPRLTTVQVPLYEIGEQGTEMLIGQMVRSFQGIPSDSPTLSPANTLRILPSRLKTGDSTAPPRVR